MMRNHEQVWKDAGKSLQGMLNADLFARWFAPIRPVEIKDDTLLLGVANEFSQIWLQDNFLSLVREAVNRTAKVPVRVKFVVVLQSIIIHVFRVLTTFRKTTCLS